MNLSRASSVARARKSFFSCGVMMYTTSWFNQREYCSGSFSFALTAPARDTVHTLRTMAIAHRWNCIFTLSYTEKGKVRRPSLEFEQNWLLELEPNCQAGVERHLVRV